MLSAPCLTLFGRLGVLYGGTAPTYCIPLYDNITNTAALSVHWPAGICAEIWRWLWLWLQSGYPQSRESASVACPTDHLCRIPPLQHKEPRKQTAEP